MKELDKEIQEEIYKWYFNRPHISKIPKELIQLKRKEIKERLIKEKYSKKIK